MTAPKALGSTEFKVTVDPAQVAAFAASAGLPADSVPLTFPACWMFAPPVKTLVRDKLGQDVMGVHVGKRFRHTRQLEIGAEYLVHVDIGLAEVKQQPNLILDLTVRDDAGALVEARSTAIIYQVEQKAAAQ